MTAPRALATLVAATCVGAAAAAPKSIVLPPDGIELAASAAPGFALAQRYCVTCHSAEYMRYQPPSAARPYWEATVKRMQTVFAAPVPDADIAPIVDYLATTYGNERAR